jgi:hypothetical protein
MMSFIVITNSIRTFEEENFEVNERNVKPITARVVKTQQKRNGQNLVSSSSDLT